MSIEIRTVGEFDGKPVLEATLQSAAGVTVKILSYGASVSDWLVPVEGGRSRSVVLGYSEFEPYRKDESYLGAIIGRVANRIAGAQFNLNGRAYVLETAGTTYQLHGGPKGIGRRNWDMSAAGDAVTLKIHSPEGEMGFPGRADFEVTYRLRDHRLEIEMNADVSEVTPISMVQHGYFNLMGRGVGNILDHEVWISASKYTVLNDDLVTTGEVRHVEGTRYDFRKPKRMRGTPDGHAFDINFVLGEFRDAHEPAAQVTAPDGALCLTLWTDRPGLQFYNGVHLAYAGLCLEDQAMPNAVNRREFPSILHSPSDPYRHRCAIEIKRPE